MVARVELLGLNASELFGETLDNLGVLLRQRRRAHLQPLSISVKPGNPGNSFYARHEGRI